jgi:hypothetical protein
MEKLQERGLGKILAVATLINDIDAICENGENIGYQIISDPTQRKYVQTIKIDPGEAFSINKVSDKRKIRVAFTGFTKETELRFDHLPNVTKKEFLTATEIKSRGFLTREGAHHFETYYSRNVSELIKLLLGKKIRKLK